MLGTSRECLITYIEKDEKHLLLVLLGSTNRFDTTDKLPNEYFIDIKVVTDRNIETYKRELQFQIVNKK